MNCNVGKDCSQILNITGWCLCQSDDAVGTSAHPLKNSEVGLDVFFSYSIKHSVVCVLSTVFPLLSVLLYLLDQQGWSLEGESARLD